VQTNEIPPYDMADNETGCCPRFHPEPWDGQELHFEDKLFVRATTVSLFHIPLNMGSIFTRTQEAIRKAQAEPASFIVLSHELSPWRAEHLFAVAAEVPEAEMVRLSGDFLTKVFEGPYRDAPKWCATMSEYAVSKGKTPGTQYLFYTACPGCAKHYGKNYVVGVAAVQ
jgi:hypothetical protein